ncbi:hypothetical protein RCC89_05835 [Cytophagaceae bacterium ABcell3]|nr:hypothetical protein RCC89_05835 [Cytophagaceae bacterium ABcell3]
MPFAKQYSTIPKNVSSNDDLDFEYLRREGIAYIEKFGSKLWTDYNTHDPGITMLEVLCYAITDLANRASLPMQDILGGKTSIEGQFFNAEEMLPSAPVTALDYRKLIIDRIDGVRNCWVSKEEVVLYADTKNNKLAYNKKAFEGTSEHRIEEVKVQGFYKFLLDVHENVDFEEVKANVFKVYHQNRNLCEDLLKVEKVASFPVQVCANIELLPEAHEEEVYANIYLALEDYLNPSFRFYSLAEMVEKGYATEDIFDGPPPVNGFLDTKEVSRAELKTEVRLSDIISLIMEVDGVKVIKEISVGRCDGGENPDRWVLPIPAGEKPVLCDKTIFNLFKGVLPLHLNQKSVERVKRRILRRKSERNKVLPEDLAFKIPEGEKFDLSAYSSIQHDLPEVYGVSDKGLPARVGKARLQKAKQLKSYLLFFDQVLASYFKHLEKVKSVLSVGKDSSGQETGYTYFTQLIKDIKGVEEIVDYPDDDDELGRRLFYELDNTTERRNQILDHLIARFAENFGNYAFAMKKLYGDSADDLLLYNKQRFLSGYDVMSRDRGSAFNYYEQPPGKLWNSENVSGFVKRVAGLAGINCINRRSFATSFIQVYFYKNSVDKREYRWRIRDKKNRIMLSATKGYPNAEAATEELFFAIRQIVESDERVVEHYLEKKTEEVFEVENFQVRKSATSKTFSFNIVDPDGRNPDYIIARQFRNHSDRLMALEAAKDLILFMKKDFTDEGIYLLEHILLLPEKEEATEDMFLPICSDDCNSTDPYSFRVSIILPGFAYRFADQEFRRFMENLIREELPSHILAKICWPGYRENTEPEVSDSEGYDVPDGCNKETNPLLKFESAYQEFLNAKAYVHKKQEKSDYQENVKALICALNGLHSIYPSGRLIDCTSEDVELKGRIVLGRTTL